MIQVQHIGKRFPGVVALDDVSFDVQPGSCHALMGENGAGKSTMGKLLAGLYRPSGGTILLDGRPVTFANPQEALRAGIGIVHQELLFCPNLTVAENLCLTALPHRGPILDRRSMRSRAADYLALVGATCDVEQPVSTLSTADEQLVQIAGVVGSGARVIVMDEPTSSLSQADALRLHGLIADLRRKGATIIYVSHRMDEIFRICDWVTVLRDGKHVATTPIAETNEAELVQRMIGRSVEQYFPSHTQSQVGPERLRVEGLSSPGKLHSIDLSVRAGEIVGLAGLVGSGRSELAEAIFGLDPHRVGHISVDGRTVSIRRPIDAMRAGIGLVPEDRKRQGLILGMSCGDNVTIAMLEQLSNRLGVIAGAKARKLVDRFFHQLRVKAADPEVVAAGLSGGNQQKLVLAKWLARSCRVLILDEPTRGVDVGAKAEIHALIDAVAAAGNAVLVISSELPEVLNLSTRVLVMRDGRIAGELSREEATQERLMRLMAGVAHEDRPTSSAA